MTAYDVPSLERLLENTEHNDAESHKLYNNLGLAHAANRDYRRSLKAHREEKKICKRLLAASPNDPLRNLDLAIAYRRCGDAMLKVDRLIDSHNVTISKRDDIIRAAHTQHSKGLEVARKAPCTYDTRPAIKLELQAASAAIAQSSLALALFTHKRSHFIDAANAATKAARLADRLVVGVAGISHDAKQSLLFGIAINYAISISGLGDKKRARKLLHTVAIRARALDDHLNLVRALSNLSEEASEENEWLLCEAYVREWARLARRADDSYDEADALRKLAIVLREKGDLHGAEEALVRSRRLHGSDDGLREADTFLEIIRREMEEHEEAREALQESQQLAIRLQQQGDYIEEATHRAVAGNNAFILRQNESVLEHLGRYFELVDEFGCIPSVTGVDEVTHNSAVANLAESYWIMKNFEEAVHWATRELAVFDGDPPGQAQAWCNLGVYLDDLGQKEKAANALKHSIAIALECGENETRLRAENNLAVVEQELLTIRRKEQSPSPTAGRHGENICQDLVDPEAQCVLQVIEPDVCTISPRKNRWSGEIRRKRTSETSNGDDSACVTIENDGTDENSVIMDSSQPMKRIKTGPEISGVRNVSDVKGDDWRTHSSTRQSMRGMVQIEEHSGSRRSMERITGGSSSRGLMNIADLAAEYRQVCEKNQQWGAKVRPMIVNAFRDLSCALLSQETRDHHHSTPIRLNLSALFVDDNDVAVVLQTLSSIGAGHDLFVDLGLNPTLSSSVFDKLSTRSIASSFGLHSIRQLDLSCAGVAPNTVRKLADLLEDGEALACTTSISLSKNGLGRYGSKFSTSILKLLTNGKKIQSLDLSLNVLSNSFLPQIAEKLGNSEVKNLLLSSSLETLDLHLNNRRAPSGLLESCEVEDGTRYITILLEAFPMLKSVDVRACGASYNVRKALSQIGESYTCPSRNVITLTDVTLDDQVTVQKVA